MLKRTMQLAFAAGARHRRCRRAVCSRFGYCLPPADKQTPSHFRCPFDESDAWEIRANVAAKIAERLIKVAERNCSARGVPSPFSPPPPADHLDLTKPLDIAALRAEATPPANAPDRA
jgi:hypothetical protein